MIWYWDDPIGSLVVFLYVMVPTLLPALPGLVVATWARRRAWRVGPLAGEAEIDGAGLAAAILEAGGATARLVTPARAPLADFYDPWHGQLRLSGAVAAGRTPGVLGIAAHEAGHSLQDHAGYWPSRLRAPVVLGARLAGVVAWMTIFAGVAMKNPGLTTRGATLFSAVALALLALRPIERDANRRVLNALPLVGVEPDEACRRALDGASWGDLAGLLPRLRRARGREVPAKPQRRA